MNPKKTNYIYYIESFFGNRLIEVLPKIEKLKVESKQTQSNYFTQNYITNPLLKFIYACAMREGTKWSIDMSLLSLQDGASSEFVYVKFLGHLLNFLENELEGNQDYKKEAVKKLLGYGSGNFYTTFCELFIGGYLKFNGCHIKFNSSKQAGSPDVVVDKPFAFANESKIFPDAEYWLQDKINENREKILNILKSFQNGQIIIMVSTMEKFDKELYPFLQNFLKLKKDQKGESIWIVSIPFRMDSNQGFVVDYPPNNSSIRLIPSFVLRDEAIQKVVDKADSQFANENLPGLIWLAFPRLKEMSMERMIIGLASQIPKDYQKKNLGMMLYDFMPTSQVAQFTGGVKYALDVFTEKTELSFINKTTFTNYIKEISDRPTILLP